MGAASGLGWDVRVFARASGAAAMALVLAWLVTAATDEGSVPWGQRAGRTLPLAPACAAVGAWLALGPARARGETRALEALGGARLRIAAAAVAGGGTVALAAALAIGAAERVDVAGAFYPTATHSAEWRWQDGGFVDRAAGVRVASDGAIAVTSERDARAVPSESVPPYGRAAAGLTTAGAGIALALLVAHSLLVREPRRRSRRDGSALGAAAGAVGASLVCFQAAAALRAPALLAVIPALALLAFAIRRYRAQP